MTAQSSETIIIEGLEYSLFAEPLESYWNDLKPKPKFFARYTSCWRGYVATWEIIAGKLYLIDINTQNDTLRISSIFPQTAGPVIANWYSGKLRIPSGELLEYVHAGYESKYERDIFITVKKGEIISIRMWTNWRSILGLRDEK
jgi:hypothetical protein